MTANVFDAARQRGTASKIGQLNATLRYGVAEEVCSNTDDARHADALLDCPSGTLSGFR